MSHLYTVPVCLLICCILVLLVYGTDFAYFVAGSRHALWSEWPFITIISIIIRYTDIRYAYKLLTPGPPRCEAPLLLAGIRKVTGLRCVLKHVQVV